jgi:hypothetical protein
MADTGSTATIDRVPRTLTHPRYCDGCGAPMTRDVQSAFGPTCWGDIRFCSNCLRTRSADELARQRREIALRGVPLS